MAAPMTREVSHIKYRRTGLFQRSLIISWYCLGLINKLNVTKPMTTAINCAITIELSMICAIKNKAELEPVP